MSRETRRTIRGHSAALGQFATGVTVISTSDGTRHVGMAVNSFAAVSLDPCLFDLSSTWYLPFRPEHVWIIIADVDMSWPKWWPNCTFAAPLVRTEAKISSQEDILKATTAHLNFKASFGYTLTINIHPTNVVTPREIDLGLPRLLLTQQNQGQSRFQSHWFRSAG